MSCPIGMPSVQLLLQSQQDMAYSVHIWACWHDAADDCSPAQVVQSKKRPSTEDNVTKRLFLYGLDEVVALGDCKTVMDKCQHLSMRRHGVSALHALHQGTQHQSIWQPSIKLNVQGHTCKQFYRSIPKCSKADRSTPNQTWVKVLNFCLSASTTWAGKKDRVTNHRSGRRA